MAIEINGVAAQPYNQEPFRGNLPKSGKAQFRIIKNVQPTRRTEDGIIPVPIPTEMFEPHYTRTTITGDTEHVRYYKTKSKIARAGIPEDVYTPDVITIDLGILTINTLTDADLYWFMTHHPKNKSNPLYDATLNDKASLFAEATHGIYLFEEIKQSQDAKKQLAFEKRINENTMAISEYSDNEAKAMYQALGVFYNADVLERSGDFDTMRMEIIKQMKSNPDKWEKLNKDTGIGIRAILKDAESKQVIQAKDGEWTWFMTREEVKKVLILKCNNTEAAQMHEELYDYVRTVSAGMKALETMKTELAFIKRNPDVPRGVNKAKE